MSRLLLVVSGFTAMLAWPVFAESPSPIANDAYSASEFFDAMDTLGVSVTPNLDPRKCAVSMDLDQNKYLDVIPTLQKRGTLNKDLSQTYINTHPFTLSMAWLMQVAAPITKVVYEDNSVIDKCSFSANVAYPDDYGSMHKKLAFTFNFTRALFKRIDWDHFVIQNLPKVAPQFRFTDWMMTEVEGEK